MTRDEIIGTVMDVLSDTFDNDDVVYDDMLTARDVEGWDSLSNIRFMVAIEEAFGRTLKMGEWQSLDNLGQLVEMLMQDA